MKTVLPAISKWGLKRAGIPKHIYFSENFGQILTTLLALRRFLGPLKAFLFEKGPPAIPDDEND